MTRFQRVCIALLVAAVASAAPAAGAQGTSGRITGIVLDSSSGRPLSSVQVLLTGTRLGAATGENGRFTIVNVPAGSYIVEARRVGYRVRRSASVALLPGGTAEVSLRMLPAALTLEAVVTTGVVDPTSGTRTPFTVGRVNAEDAPVPAANAVETLAGKVAGVTITSGGQPGSGTNILLRSPSSISRSTSPLIVVDGVILSQSFDASSADLESMEIESVEVVKGAAAASLYGSRASAGVIQIRTKRGASNAEGQTNSTVRSEVGRNTLGGQIDWARNHYYLTNAAGDYVNAAGTVVSRAQRVPKPASSRFQDTEYKDPVYDQVDLFFDPGMFTKNSVTVSQNAGRTNWLMSFNNTDEDGVVLNSGRNVQNNVRVNLDHALRDNLRLGISAYHNRSERQNLYGDTFFDLINQAPDIDLLQRDTVRNFPYLFQNDPEGREENPLYVLSTEQNERRRARTQGSVEAKFTPRSWLTFDGNVSYDRSDRRNNFFLDAGVLTEGNSTPTGGTGQIIQTNGTTDALNAAGSINLLGVVRGITLRSSLRALMERESNSVATAEGLVLTTPGVKSLSNATQRQVTSSLEEIRSVGYTATMGAEYGGRYILDGLVRRDGSSLFGPEERYKVYYRGSAAWRVAEERWWPFKSVSEFKLRASQGTAGGRPDFEDQYETLEFLAGGGLRKATLGNRFLRPETAKETEIGLDAIVKERYSVQLTYARSRVTDQLIAIPLAGFFGYTTQTQNAGTVEGNTYEGTIEAQLLRRPTFSWRMGIVADRSRNRITEFDRSCFTTNTIGYRCAGETLGAMYGFNFIKDASQLPTGAQSRANEFAVNDEGILVYVGAGNTFRDGQAKSLWGTTATVGGANYAWGMPITQKDSAGNAAVTRIGDGNPDLHFGVSNNITWKNLSVFALVDANIGGQVYNQTTQRMYQYGRHADVDQSGKEQELKKPVDYYVALYAANDPTDYFVQPGGFVKLREMSLRYRLAGNALRAVSRLGARGVSVGVIGRNLLTVTNYRGYDPEVSDSDFPTTLRLDSFGYPRYRTFTGSVTLDF